LTTIGKLSITSNAGNNF